MLVALLATVQMSGTTKTDPVGYVTFTAADEVDTKFGLIMEQTKVLGTGVVSVSSGTVAVSVDGSQASDAHYLQFSSGALAGQWFQVTGSTADSVTVAEDLETLGAVENDTFKIVPFWTLSSLFGIDFTVSTNVFSPAAQVILNDVTSVGIKKAPAFNYAYHDGSSGFVAEGWFDANNAFAGVQDDTKLSPDTFITIRNVSGSEYRLILPGAVPSTPLSIPIVSAPTSNDNTSNDNLVYNPYPAPIQLSLSGLTDVVDVSTDVFSPTSQVIVYESFNGLNPSPTANYAYHDGSSGFVDEGWFDANNAFAGVQDTVTIPQGGAFFVRKGAGTPSLYWTASLPYTL